MRTTLSSARRGWPATSNKKNQRYGKDDQSDRTNDQSQQLGEKRDIRRCHRLWPLSDEVAQIMQGLSERAENRSNCYQSADDHRYQAYSTTSPRDGVHEVRSEEHTSELQSRGHLVCRLLLEKKKKIKVLH